MRKSIVKFISAMLAIIVLAMTMPIPSNIARATEGTVRTVRVGWVLRDNISEERDGEYSGYNYDFLMEIAKYTGWEYEFVIGSNDELCGKLERGEIDLLGTLLYSEERANVIDYAQLPEGHKYTVLFATSDSPIDENDFEAFDDIHIGALMGDSATLERLSVFAKASGFRYSVTEYDSTESLAAAMDESEVDAGVIDTYMVGDGYRILAEFAPTPYYFATTKGDNEILNLLNRALYQLNIDRPYLERELYEKYFGIHFDAELSEADLALIEESQTTPIRVGVIPSSAPACYLDEETGEYKGIFMELLNAVSDKTGLRFELVAFDLSLGSPISQVREKTTTLAAGVVKSERFESDDTLVLSDTLLTDTLVLVGRKADDFTQDAENKTIAIVKGFQVAEEYIREKFPNHTIVEYSTPGECLDSLVDGDTDATVYTRTCMNYMLHNPRYENLEVISAYYCDVETCIAGLSSESAQIVSIINKGLAMLSEVERNDIIMNTTIMNPYRMTAVDLLYKYRIPVMVIVVLLMAIIALLTVSNLTIKHSERRLQAALSSEQKAHEQEKVALAIAEKASAAKGSFMSRMSHEIRTPLNAVIGYNTIARSELKKAKTNTEIRHAEERVLDCLTKSSMASKYLLTIINDVLDMSAIESGKIVIAKEIFDFKAMISSLNAIFYSQASAKKVDFEVIIHSPAQEWLVGDQMRVNQILTNLLSNAIKFTSEGGKVTLCISSETNGDTVNMRFDVTDTGIGMAKEYLERIWQPFEQADATIARRFGGTGLGLSITKTLTDLMNGTVTVESIPGKGSTFSVRLPLGVAKTPPEMQSYDLSKINALVVDDDADMCEYIKLLFSNYGVTNTTVASGKAAIESAEAAIAAHNPYNVFFVDWKMPDMDGFETIRQLRRIVGDDVTIIVVTAYDYAEIHERASEVGVSQIISKPVYGSSLLDVLVNISGGKASMQRADNRNKYDFDGARVMLAEDNGMNMEIARRILESANIVVDCVWNGQEAYDKFMSSPQGTYMAILMDIQMPVMDGHQATRAIRASRHAEAKTIPVIAMTADAFAENVSEALASGMNDHIAKPIDLSKLFGTLKKYHKK